MGVAGARESPLPVRVGIEVMRAWHIPAVYSIERRVYPRPWSPSLFYSEISRPSTRYYIVAKDGRKVVGYGGEAFVADEAHITNVAVHPDYQGAKVGTQIMMALTTEARRRGAETITLEVRVSNLIAQGLYRKFGFVPVGLRPRYYLETGEDALVMMVRDVGSAAYGERLEAIRRELGRVLPPPP